MIFPHIWWFRTSLKFTLSKITVSLWGAVNKEGNSDLIRQFNSLKHTLYIRLGEKLQYDRSEGLNTWQTLKNQDCVCSVVLLLRCIRTENFLDLICMYPNTQSIHLTTQIALVWPHFCQQSQNAQSHIKKQETHFHPSPQIHTVLSFPLRQLWVFHTYTICQSPELKSLPTHKCCVYMTEFFLFRCGNFGKLSAWKWFWIIYRVAAV